MACAAVVGKHLRFDFNLVGMSPLENCSGATIEDSLVMMCDKCGPFDSAGEEKSGMECEIRGIGDGDPSPPLQPLPVRVRKCGPDF